MYQERTYRNGMLDGRFSTVTFSVQETDLFIGWTPSVDSGRIRDAARHLVVSLRSQIRSASDPRFLTSLTPLAGDGETPLLAAMLQAGRAAGVGPMASVAGAIAQEVGSALKRRFSLDEVVVENGGDLFVDVWESIVVKVVAPGNPLDGRIGIRVLPSSCPIGIATSSGTTGPSLSFGSADAVMVACQDAALADAYATAFCNRVHGENDLPSVARQAKILHTVKGFLALCGDKLAVAGDLEVVSL